MYTQLIRFDFNKNTFHRFIWDRELIKFFMINIFFQEKKYTTPDLKFL